LCVTFKDFLAFYFVWNWGFLIYLNLKCHPGGSTWLPGASLIRAQDVGHPEDPEPRATADRDASLQAHAAGGARAHRGAALAPPGGAASAPPGQLARQGDRRAELQGEHALFISNFDVSCGAQDRTKE
jgi:hypothetical protein